MKNPWVVIGIITVVLFGGAIWYSSASAERNNEGVEIQQNIKGNAAAETTLVKYSDFQCPACAAFYPVVADILEREGENISFEYKHFPLSNIHANAQPAAVAAEAAGQQGKFYEMHDLLFENQSEWSQAAVPNALFLRYAEEIGLDISLFRRHQNASLLRDKVRNEFAEGRDLGVTGTPTFFLNGERMIFTTYPEFENQVLEAINPGSVEGMSEGVEQTSTEPEVIFGI